MSHRAQLVQEATTPNICYLLCASASGNTPRLCLDTTASAPRTNQNQGQDSTPVHVVMTARGSSSTPTHSCRLAFGCCWLPFLMHLPVTNTAATSAAAAMADSRHHKAIMPLLLRFEPIPPPARYPHGPILLCSSRLHQPCWVHPQCCQLSRHDVHLTRHDLLVLAGITPGAAAVQGPGGQPAP